VTGPVVAAVQMGDEGNAVRLHAGVAFPAGHVQWRHRAKRRVLSAAIKTGHQSTPRRSLRASKARAPRLRRRGSEWGLPGELCAVCLVQHVRTAPESTVRCS
jgi:hypothetical protein